MATSSPIGQPADPLTPTNFGGWFQRVVGVIRRSFANLVIIQIGIAVASTIIAGIITDVGVSLMRGKYSSGGLPIGLTLGLVLPSFLILLAVTSCAQVASFFIAILDAAGEPARVGTAVSLAARRTLPLLGWSFVAAIMMVGGLMLLVIPAIYLVIVFYASLTGVVAVEHKGIGRAFELVNRRFWPTAGRILFALLVFAIYFLMVIGINYALGPDSITASVLSWISSILLGLGTVAVSVVTYTELRFHENPSTLTPELAAEIRR